MVIALLSVQMNESFASSQMSCGDEMATEMFHGAHDMMDHSQSDDMKDCCDSDCCCPMAVFHAGLLSEQPQSPQDNVSLSIQSHSPNLHQIFLGALQRPPKYSLV